MEGKVVIITGAAQGIGRACAERFAREGAAVVLVDCCEEKGEALAERLRDEGHETLFIKADVAKRFDVRNVLAETLDTFERVDVLINNAAILDSAPFLELDEETFDRVLRVNLKGYFLMGQAVARQLLTQLEQQTEKLPEWERGSIINMSSVNAVFALPDHVAYTVSKGGIAQLTKAMALALAPYRIRVNAIGPGSIDTPILDAVMTDDAMRKRILSRTPMGRIGKPEEIAAIAYFLAGKEAAYITGQTIYADGGRLPLNYVVDVKE